MYKSYFYIFFCSFDLLTTRIANLSVEDIPKPEYLQTNAYYWCNSFWYLYRGLVLNRKWNVFSTVSSIVQLLLFSYLQQQANLIPGLNLNALGIFSSGLPVLPPAAGSRGAVPPMPPAGYNPFLVSFVPPTNQFYRLNCGGYFWFDEIILYSARGEQTVPWNKK